MATILIVEDQEITRIYLKQLLEEMNEDINVIGAGTAQEALELANKQAIDLFFLDIELPDFSGLELAYELRRIPQYKFTYVVFLTTYVQNMIEAFKKIHCYDYIIKPFEDIEVTQTARTLLEGIKPKKKVEKERPYALFESRQCTIKIFLDEIIFAEVNARHCIVHTINEVYTFPYMTLKSFLEHLPENNFIQCHRAYVINPQWISRVEKTEDYVYFKNYDKVAMLGKKFGTVVSEKLSKYGS